MLNLFKYIISIGIIFGSSVAVAGTMTFNPNMPSQQTMTLECTYPIEREDGTVLNIGDISHITSYWIKDGVRTLHNTNDNECKIVTDTRELVDGTYKFILTTVDTDGRESMDSETAITVIIERTDTTVNVIHIDPTLPNERTMTLTCTYPTEREDGTVLSIEEIAHIALYWTKDGDRVLHGINENECKMIVNTTELDDGKYAFTVTTVDTDGRESPDSIEIVELVITRRSNPNPVTNIQVEIK